MNFRTAFYDNRGVLIISKPEIARTYAQSWLALDVVTCLPISYVAMIAENDTDQAGAGKEVHATPTLPRNNTTAFTLGRGACCSLSRHLQVRSFKILRLLKLAKLLRIARILRMLERYRDELRSALPPPPLPSTPLPCAQPRPRPLPLTRICVLAGRSCKCLGRSSARSPSSSSPT